MTSLSSYSNALVLLPPASIAERINQFRLVHDKAGFRWTPHITLIFPFIGDEDLSATIELIRQALSVSSINPFPFKLDRVGYFRQSAVDTVHLAPGDPTQIHALWTILSKELGYKGRPFVAHLTVGQASRKSQDALDFLNSKGRALRDAITDLEWIVGSVAVLRKDESDGGVMKLVEEIFLPGYVGAPFRPLLLYPTAQHVGVGWKTLEFAKSARLPAKFSVATYNILSDPAFPPASRIDQLQRVIMNSNPDILCLQEVSDELLELLLGSPILSGTYIFSSRAPGFIYENERNILILSKYSFTWSKLEIGGKHKPALLVTFLGSDSKTLNFAAIHLTAGRTASTITQKTAELEALMTHIGAQESEGDWVVLGDTNWPNTHPTTPLDALFEDVASEDPQATFDPNLNSLAAQTTRENRLPQRYDRIYFQKRSNLHPSSVSLFGKEGAVPASDHWGLLVEFEPRPAKTETGSIATSYSYTALPETRLSSEELKAVCNAHQWLPSLDQEEKFSAALRAIRNVFSSWPTSSPSSAATSTTPSSIVKIRVEPVGSYALAVHTSDSDLDCLAVGNISAGTFWRVSRTRLRGQANQDGMVKLRRFVKDAMVQMMELEVDGIKVDLQYCAAARLVEKWGDIDNLPRDSPLFSLPVSSLITLNAFRDSLALRRTLPSMETFQAANRALKLYLKLQGLQGARFGFLGGFHLTLLLTRIALTLPPNARAEHLVRQFFKTYGSWDWGADMVSPIPERQLTYKRVQQKEPMVILSIEKPIANLTFNASRNSVEVLSRAFRLGDELLNAGKSWAEVCGSGPNTKEPLELFLESCKTFIKIDVGYWGGSCLRGREVVGWLESKIVVLLVQLYSTVPELNARFWPKRLVDASTVDTSARDPNGFYLLGVSPSVSFSKDKSTRKGSEIQASLLNCLRTFEGDLHANSKYYDNIETFIGLSSLNLSQLPSKVIPDAFLWPDNGIDPPIDEDSDDEEDVTPSLLTNMTPDGQDGEGPPTEEDWSQFRPISASKRKKAAAKSKDTPHVPAGKLRTSSDVFNRLMWDPNISKEEYVIGYEDRFLGVKEGSLASWKREVEDESFIPFHRVVYFKRVADGFHVWDKRTKVDHVFGSGRGVN